MSNVVQIIVNEQEHNLGIKEYRKQRVITFKDIDTLHGRADGTAGRNFRENRERFIKKIDYFEIDQPDEIRRLGFERPQGGTPEKIILLTESGYLMLAKSLTDDLAWQVQRQLVNVYFRAKNTGYSSRNNSTTILKRHVTMANTLGKGLPKSQQIELRRLAVIRAAEESGEDYSDILAVFETPKRFDVTETVSNIQPLFDYLNENPDIGTIYNGYLYIKSKEFQNIIRKLEMNYLAVIRELDKATMIKARIDKNKRYFTSRVPTAVGKYRDYYVAVKYPHNI